MYPEKLFGDGDLLRDEISHLVPLRAAKGRYARRAGIFAVPRSCTLGDRRGHMSFPVIRLSRIANVVGNI